jgi:hypothetical protein
VYTKYLVLFSFKAILAAVIVVALKKMILEVRTFPEIYKKNKLEGVIETNLTHL